MRSRRVVMGIFGQPGCPIALHSNRRSIFFFNFLNTYVGRTIPTTSSNDQPKSVTEICGQSCGQNVQRLYTDF